MISKRFQQLISISLAILVLFGLAVTFFAKEEVHQVIHTTYNHIRYEKSTRMIQQNNKLMMYLAQSVSRAQYSGKPGPYCAFSNSNVDLNDDTLYSIPELLKCLEIDQETKSELARLQFQFKNLIKHLHYPKRVYKGAGIVMVGGQENTIKTLTALQSLRSARSVLPVEVLIPPSDEQDVEYCESVLPQYNARCLYFGQFLSPEIIKTVNFREHHHKSLALLGSSFEKVLFLDSDTFVVNNVDHLFASRAFADTGLVLWLDSVRRSISPIFYEIGGKPVTSDRVRYKQDDLSSTEGLSTMEIPMNDLQGSLSDMSTSASQLLINKKQHYSTLLLSLYYNLGSQWYYHMLAQRDTEDAEKETYAAAAHILGNRFYQVKSQSSSKGRVVDGKYRAFGHLHYDAAADYEVYQHATKTANYASFMKLFRNLKPLFLTADSVNLDPYHQWKNNAFKKDDGEWYRGLDKVKQITRFDLEEEAARTVYTYVCSEDVQFVRIAELFQGRKEEKRDMCSWLENRFNWLKRDPY